MSSWLISNIDGLILSSLDRVNYYFQSLPFSFPTYIYDLTNQRVRCLTIGNEYYILNNLGDRLQLSSDQPSFTVSSSSQTIFRVDNIQDGIYVTFSIIAPNLQVQQTVVLKDIYHNTLRFDCPDCPCSENLLCSNHQCVDPCLNAPCGGSCLGSCPVNYSCISGISGYTCSPNPCSDTFGICPGEEVCIGEGNKWICKEVCSDTKQGICPGEQTCQQTLNGWRCVDKVYQRWEFWLTLILGLFLVIILIIFIVWINR